MIHVFARFQKFDLVWKQIPQQEDIQIHVFEIVQNCLHALDKIRIHFNVVLAENAEWFFTGYKKRANHVEVTEHTRMAFLCGKLIPLHLASDILSLLVPWVQL